MERAAGTFQGKLVTELRLAKANNIQQANEILERFIPHFSTKLAVKPEQPDSACRPLGSGLSLADILCSKHSSKVDRDNLVKYNCSTLQLLPGEGRPAMPERR